MKYTLDNYSDLTDKIKPFLRQYLEDNGVSIIDKGATPFFSCISPDHDDSDPSAGFVKGSNEEVFHCFSCGVSGNIFNAANFLENKPLWGAGFLKDNLDYLLNKYGIEHEPIELSDDQLSKLKYDRLYQIVADILSSRTGTLVSYEHAKNRGWSESICKALSLGSVNNLDSFIEEVSRLSSIPKDEIISMGIRDPLFGPDFITFTIRDYTGIPAGFVSRYVLFTKGCGKEKYYNTSSKDNPFFSKEELLYCIERARTQNTRRLDIFEGYGSAVTAHQHDYKNCVALGGTAFTDAHIDLIKSLGFTNVNLVLDQDETGTTLMAKYMEKLSGNTGLQITVTHLPLSAEDRAIPGQNDPDYFIRKYGIEEYRKLKPEGLFHHVIRKYQNAMDLDSNPMVAKEMAVKIIPTIINEPNLIERGHMISILSKISGVDKEDIKDEIRRIESTDVRLIRDEIGKRLRSIGNADSLREFLAESLSKIKSSSDTKKDRWLLSVGETVETFDHIFASIESQKEGIHGWKTGFLPLDNMLDGIPKPIKGGNALGFAGYAQHNKSTMLLNLSLNIARHNDDAAVCYWAIDDNRKAIAYRLISMISGVSMKKVRKTVPRSDLEEKAIKDAQELIRDMISTRRISFKDDTYGRSKKKAENWLKETQDATGKHLLLCVDSLHNVHGTDDSETRVKIIGTCAWIKSLCVSLPATVMASIELVKNRSHGEKPTLTQISETAKVEYDFDMLAIIWNAAQGSFLPVDAVSAKWGCPGAWKPLVELDIQKNKIGSGEKGSVFFKFDPDTVGFVGCSSYKDYDPANKVLEIPSANGVSYSFSRDKTSGVPIKPNW